MVLDDGPHTLDSMLKCIDIYLPRLAKGGILMIEDIPKMKWIPLLRRRVPRRYQSRVYDRRKVKGRYDDVVFVVTKKAR